jgi:uncharacterized protein (TIGR00299 family) protein
MNMAALIDLGVDQSYLINELKKLGVSGYSISFSKDQRKGITGTRADVIIQENEGLQLGAKTFSFDGLKSVSNKQLKHTPNTHQDVRNFRDIKKLIQESSLNEIVKKISIDIFQKVALAEAHVHGKPVDEVHFHEVGAVDSIVDIVGAAICIDFLKPDKIISSPVQLGGGMVKCAHGLFPVPAPATAEILKGKPVKLGAVQVETTTPTGAAILAALVDEFMDQPALNIIKIAYGIGHRDNILPNVLRVCWGSSDSTSANDYLIANATIVECNIDDMNPEIYEYIMEKLLEAGADDVYLQSIIMKKSRPAIKLSVLCQNSLVSTVEDILFTKTSTLGLRKYEVQKTMLKRDWKTVKTQWGDVKVKYGYINGKIIKSKPEYEDCLNIARANNISIADVYNEVASLINFKPNI